MRLYKDVKIEAQVNITATVSAIDSSVKSTKTTNDLIHLDNVRDNFKRNVRSEFEEAIKDVISECEDTRLLKLTVDSTKISSHVNNGSHVELTTVANAQLSLAVYGKLFIGLSPDFEECFETRSGLKLNEIISSVAIQNVFLHNCSEDMDALKINVTYAFSDDVKLLLNDEEFRDAIYASEGEIMDAIGSRLGEYINPYDDD